MCFHEKAVLSNMQFYPSQHGDRCISYSSVCAEPDVRSRRQLFTSEASPQLVLLKYSGKRKATDVQKNQTNPTKKLIN